MRRVLVVVAMLSMAGPVLAQEAAGSIAVGLGLSNFFYGGECRVDHCSRIGKTVFGEGALNVTERVAAVMGFGISFNNSLSTASRANGWEQRDARANSVSFGGGVRVYGAPGWTRAFAEVVIGFVDQGVTVSNDSMVRDSWSVSGPWWSLGAGGDFAMGEGVAVRVSGSVTSASIEGVRTTGVGGGVGLVFGFGGR